MMTYDYTGPDWADPDVVGHNAALTDPVPDSSSQDPYSSSRNNVEANIMQWIAGGASPSKITLVAALASLLSFEDLLFASKFRFRECSSSCELTKPAPSLLLRPCAGNCRTRF